jgi:hypothetical protein
MPIRDDVRREAVTGMIDHLNWSEDADRSLEQRGKIVELTMDLVEKYMAEDVMEKFYLDLLADLRQTKK